MPRTCSTGGSWNMAAISRSASPGRFAGGHCAGLASGTLGPLSLRPPRQHSPGPQPRGGRPLGNRPLHSLDLREKRPLGMGAWESEHVGIGLCWATRPVPASVPGAAVNAPSWESENQTTSSTGAQAGAPDYQQAPRPSPMVRSSREANFSPQR